MMLKTPLSLGFIGGSVQSAVGYTHLVSCAMDNQWELKAGCFSSNPQRNQDSARAYQVADDRLYNDWRFMLEKEKGKLDAVVILAPTPLHYEITKGCLDENIPAICEKPLAMSSLDIEKILETRSRSKGFLAVTYNYSGYPMLRELRHRIRKGDLGEILHFQAEMPQEGFIRTDKQGNKPIPQAWRLADGEVPAIYLDLGVHLHQLLHYVIGKTPIEVTASQNSYGLFSPIVDNVICLCRYSGNIQGQIWFSKSALGHRNGLRLRIYGSKASAEWYQMNPEELILSYSNGRREIVDRAAGSDVANLQRYARFKAGHPAGFIEAFANLYVDLADCLRQYQATGHWESENVFGAELALEGLHMLEAMKASIDSRTWQRVHAKHHE